jgi:hypothetical protein
VALAPDARSGSTQPSPRPAPVRLALHLPAQARAGEVIAVHVDVQAQVPVRSLVFSLAYDASHLRLVGRDEGTFVRRPGVAAELSVDEPSDGNAEVVFRAIDGSAASGAGSIAVLEFEALQAGEPSIEAQDVRAVDAGGNTIARVSGARARIAIR